MTQLPPARAGHQGLFTPHTLRREPKYSKNNTTSLVAQLPLKTTQLAQHTPVRVSLFCISGDVSSGFPSQRGFCFIHFCRGECKVHSIRSICGATRADHLTVSMVAIHFPTCISRGRSWLGIEWAIYWCKLRNSN